MPILAAEPSVFPGDLLDSARPGDPSCRWWAVYTKARQEKSLARQLVSLEVPFYLPLVPKVSNIGGRRVKSLLPLFGGYLFLYGTHEDRLKALATKRIVYTLEAPETEAMARDLQNVRALINSGAPLTEEAQLEPGQRVRIKSGTLMGVEGVITSRRGEDRLLVAVQFLQQGVSVLIKDYCVEIV